MSEILFLSHRIPFPPDRGDKIRSHHILKRLARIAPVHVATFADDEEDARHEAALASVAKSHCLVRRSKSLTWAGIEALVTARPVSVTAFRHRAIARYVARLLVTRPIAAIYVFSGQMGQYVPASFTGRVVADFVDVDSAKFDAYAEKGRGLRGWIDAREGVFLRAEEARLAGRANVSLLISTDEARLFKSRLPHSRSTRYAVRALANGIDSMLFDRELVGRESRVLASSGPRLIFTGQMDYAPNVDAAMRVIGSILPKIRQSFPDATFHVVGRSPTPRLLAHHGRDGAYVWGRVPDMRCWLKAADVALVPLDIGRGVQNKVLEAMAMELPVVLSPEAATGIPADHGRDFLIGEHDDALAAHVAEVLRNPDRAGALGRSARKFVVEQASWDAALASLPEIIGMATSSQPRGQTDLSRNAA